jgi:hypothetical protein
LQNLRHSTDLLACADKVANGRAEVLNDSQQAFAAIASSSSKHRRYSLQLVFCDDARGPITHKQLTRSKRSDIMHATISSLEAEQATMAIMYILAPLQPQSGTK